MPEAAVFEDLSDELALAGFDEGDDFHSAAALGAQQRVGSVAALDEHGPAPEAASVEAISRRRIGDSGGFCGVVPFRLFGAPAAGLVGVVAVSADEVFALIGDVLGEFGEEVEEIEGLEVAGHAADQVVG